MNILHIDSSISEDQSVSRRLSAAVVDRLSLSGAKGSKVYRDLAVAPVPHQSPAIQFAKLKMLYELGALSGDAAAVVQEALNQGVNVDPATQAAFAETNLVLEEFLKANVIVIGAPMYNFGIPSQLKAWVDCLAVPGKTFRYTSRGAEGLAGNKRLIVASSRGGIYTAPSPISAMDHQEAFLKSFFGFIGVQDITFVRAEGLNTSAEHRQNAVESALNEAATLSIA